MVESACNSQQEAGRRSKAAAEPFKVSSRWRQESQCSNQLTGKASLICTVRIPRA